MITSPSIPLPLLLALSLLFVGASIANDYQLQTLEHAHGQFHAATNAAMYAEAAESYERLIQEEGVRNGNLFYTAGNSWFMASDLGRALLNYRRAEEYVPGNADLQHNLRTVRSLRTDVIPPRELSGLSARLLGWHAQTSRTQRGWLFAVFWLGLWGSLGARIRTGRKEAGIVALASGTLAAILLISLLTDSVVDQRAPPGVVVSRDLVARKGDGVMYAPAFVEPLHAGTEFRLLEDRGAWWHVRLADGQTCWIPATEAETVRLSTR